MQTILDLSKAEQIGYRIMPAINNGIEGLGNPCTGITGHCPQLPET